jgi:hypothetical protein
MGIGVFELKNMSQDHWADFYVAGALLPWVFVYPLYKIDFDKLTPVAPVLTLWAGLGVIALTRRLSASGQSSRRIIFRRSFRVSVGIVLLVCVFGFPDYIRPFREDNFYDQLEDDPVNRRVGEWIKTNLPKDATLMARKAFIAAYADRKHIPLPFAEYPDVIEYARIKGVDVMIIEEKTRRIRPSLAFLLEQSPDVQDLIRVFSTQSDKGDKIIVYRVLPDRNK